MPRTERVAGIPATELSDEDLDRELAHALEKRHDIFIDGTAEQLRNHSARTHELERAYLARFTERVNDGREKLGG